MPASLAQVVQWLRADVLCCAHALDRSINMCHGSDLMSDVLAFSHPNTLLLTGLTNPQVVRTAEVAGIYGVVFVRGKRPHDVMVALAEEYELPLMVSPYAMFDACGLLFSQGLRGWSLCGQGSRS